jgi:hypothetical protein
VSKCGMPLFALNGAEPRYIPLGGCSIRHKKTPITAIRILH